MGYLKEAGKEGDFASLGCSSEALSWKECLISTNDWTTLTGLSCGFGSGGHFFRKVFAASKDLGSNCHLSPRSLIVPLEGSTTCAEATLKPFLISTGNEGVVGVIGDSTVGHPRTIRQVQQHAKQPEKTQSEFRHCSGPGRQELAGQCCKVDHGLGTGFHTQQILPGGQAGPD